jgi:hypothetical protein
MPDMKLTLGQMLEMHRAISGLAASGLSVAVLTGVDLALNQAVLKPYVDGYNTALKFTPAYETYVAELTVVQTDEAAKKDGRPVMFGRMFVFENPVRAETRIDALMAKHAAAIEERKKIETDAAASESKEYSVGLIEIDRNAFKGESASAVEIMSALLPILRKA